MKVDAARNDLPITHDTFRKKQDIKAKVQVPPLLRQRHNALSGSIVFCIVLKFSRQYKRINIINHKNITKN